MRLGAIKERRSQRDKGTWKESWERGRDYHAIMVSGQTYGRILNSARKGFKGETSFPKRKIGNQAGLERGSFLRSPPWLQKET